MPDTLVDTQCKKCKRRKLRQVWKIKQWSGYCRKCYIPRFYPPLPPHHHKLMNVWQLMKYRCTNPKDDHYHRYGGRGIKVSKKWDLFSTFYQWSLSNGYKQGLKIDRIDNNGNYTPSNCRWVTQQKQSQNTSSNKLSKRLVQKLRSDFRKSGMTAFGFSKEHCTKFNITRVGLYYALRKETWSNV